MLNYRIETAAANHLLKVAAKMRAADRREIWASHRRTPYEALTVSLHNSTRAWTAFIDEEPVMVWGVGQSEHDWKGVPWMLATDDLAKGRREFIKQSRQAVDRMQAGYKLLENYAHAENSLSLRWLSWCGFTVDPGPVYFNGEAFHRFWRLDDV